MTTTRTTEGLAGELTGKGHRLVQRVYYEDTDFSGVVYHARYLHFLERGRTDFLRLLGVDQGAMAARSESLAFVVRHMEIDFRTPARMDDILTIETAPAAIGGARLELLQSILRDGRVLITARVKVALIDANGRPRRMPAELAAAFASEMAPEGRAE
ncbi:tol-pal system-associated acyl-CoA thioesterase [Pararhizobium haloflavum]|uniref:tol-pal system-associated acyl-CoA thioesterase n=1 Tax=Pararhizobium haloflavum TaxID=2037914 RepID=UPI000C1A39E6|nr:tol-pal system-associated acyl-CoA thioesterase [Pararhizobium haloflavum]